MQVSFPVTRRVPASPTQSVTMTNRLSRAISRALSPRPDEGHVHVDVDGEHVCEDFRCPHHRSDGALEPLPFGALHHRGLRR